MTQEHTPPALRCANHPNVETALRCASCDKPICPKCYIYTPVGIKCRQCARLRRLPVYNVPLPYYARAVGAMVASAALASVLWVLLWDAFYSFLLLSIVVWLGTGYLIGEAVSQSANRKSSPYLQVIAGLGPVIVYVASILAFNSQHFVDASFVNPYRLVGVVLAVIVAGGRLRF
ncbi:MAG: B-box zinc finger protein [Chloroflexi bacterium]|nr:B-box zinc finger protein [Chloroflexota bacterium]